MIREIEHCRICGSRNLQSVLDLGKQALTGSFPRSREEQVPAVPLELVKCGPDNGDCCGLLQLRHSFDLKHLYGDNYGYRSGLNQSMVMHLHSKVAGILQLVALQSGDLIIDVGSNDSTLLQAYPSEKKLHLLGIDPVGKKFQKHYPAHIDLLPDFFSSAAVRERFGRVKAKVVTSIAMFYDLEQPLDFMRQIHDILADDGLWVFEQSYMPSMLEQNAYDTICHEHLEYYGLKQIKWLAERAGLRILDVEFNDVNGGSFSITAEKANSTRNGNVQKVQQILEAEQRQGLDCMTPYLEFKRRVHEHREQLIRLMKAKASNALVIGSGASTKGNVILQFCGLTREEIPYIAEVNEDKFGCYTPGTGIPIISEDEARNLQPDYLLILPWHFRRFFLRKEESFLEDGGALIFPLPRIEVVSRETAPSAEAF